ncbi:MAG: hypothetical protein JO199_12100, partial [Candidatus Eremiobacteraeota bacterium]|nr:hypothetical protein [Candidatus Eremiobacteraeota bacterium]
LAAGRTPHVILTAIVGDLAAYDLQAAIALVRQRNVAAQFDRSADGPAIVRRTARLLWLLLAYRTLDDAKTIDLTRTDLSQADLRADGIAAGVGMNLGNVNFSRATLPGGTWQSSNLSDAIFDGASTTGRLVCAYCTWSGVSGTRVLANGKWVTP